MDWGLARGIVNEKSMLKALTKKQRPNEPRDP